MDKLRVFVIFSILGLFVMGFASAQTVEGIGNPGITPDSGFYFLDRIFDGFQGAESLANEKAAEAVVMAQKGDEEAANRSLGLYERNLERLQERARGDEDVAERVANQTTRHMVVLAGVLEQVPEEAKGAIERAMENSVRGREEAVEALKEIDPSRGEQVARETLQRVMSETPEQAQEGLQQAFNSIGKGEEFSQAREGGIPEGAGQGNTSGAQAGQEAGQAQAGTENNDSISGQEDAQEQGSGNGVF